MLKKYNTIVKDQVKEQPSSRSQKHNLKALTMCGTCYVFYYKNSWHFEKPDTTTSNTNQDAPIHFIQCPACVQQELACYGVVQGSFTE